jgi:ATP-dependent exoDNAse (exonuclease V) beta subunit
MRLDGEIQSLEDLPQELGCVDASSIEPVVRKPDPFQVDLKAAASAASDAPEKVTPHQLVADNDREGREARLDDRNAPIPLSHTQYGTWWHETMRTMPWKSPDRYQSHFERALQICPEVERAQREWDMFTQSPLIEQLGRAELVRTECPFIIPAGTNSLEGVIDLVYKFEGRWFVLDWKTTQSHSATSAVEVYRPQIRPYRDVVSRMLGVVATAVIYLTATGDLAEAA